MTKKSVNWTSTKVPLWETDCLQFWRAGQPFEVRDVTTEDHLLFVARFAEAHELEIRQDGSTVIFSLPESAVC
jgi:hypothetical protein